MVHKKFQKVIICCLLTFGFREVFANVTKIEQEFSVTLKKFSEIEQQSLDVQIGLMPQFFSEFEQPYQEIMKKLHKNIQILSKEIKILKRNQQSWQALHHLKMKLSDLYKFIKKYRLQYEVVVFHQMIQNQWGSLFQALAHKEDILSCVESLGDELKDADTLKQMMKKVEKDLRKIDIYEYRLHSDWIDTKLANYVLKIELTRLRNGILFHPLYKRTKLKLSSNYPR